MYMFYHHFQEWKKHVKYVWLFFALIWSDIKVPNETCNNSINFETRKMRIKNGWFRSPIDIRIKTILQT